MVSDYVTSNITCDICGYKKETTSQIKPGDVFDREFPTGWTVGYNPQMCICPECDQKLHANSVSVQNTDEPKETIEDEFTEDTPWIVRRADELKRYCALQKTCATCLLNKTGTKDTECLLKHIPIDYESCTVSEDWIEAESRLNLYALPSKGKIVRNLIDYCNETKCEDCCFHEAFCEFHRSVPKDWNLDIEK